MLKRFFLIISLLLIFFLGYAQAGINNSMQDLISKVCYDLENCETEGKILFQLGHPINEIIASMCKLHLDTNRRLKCYQDSFNFAVTLKHEVILAGYEQTFTVSQLKSYYHYVKRNCLEIPDLEEYVKCWNYFSINLKKELRKILKKNTK